jgi:hypothetical protein
MIEAVHVYVLVESSREMTRRPGMQVNSNGCVCVIGQARMSVRA